MCCTVIVYVDRPTKHYSHVCRIYETNVLTVERVVETPNYQSINLILVRLHL